MLVTLIFGGNQGDRKALIDEAITEMSSIGKIERCSSLYETAPWGFESSVRRGVLMIWESQNKNSDEFAPVLSSVPEPWI